MLKPYALKILISIRAVSKMNMGISMNGIGEKPAAIIKGIVELIKKFDIRFPLSIKSSTDDIHEKKLKLLCK